MSTKTMILTGALALACTSFAADTSDAIFMYVKPEQSSFWRTAPDTTVTLPINYPEGATKATLTVTGVQYQQVYDNITAATYELELPAATGAYAGNSYTLTLSFDAGDSQTAQISVIDGVLAGGEGATRCLSSEIAAWTRMPTPRMTLPIPYGATSLTYNDAEVGTGLGGAQGFCTVPSKPGKYVLTVGGEDYEANLQPASGFVVIFR